MPLLCSALLCLIQPSCFVSISLFICTSVSCVYQCEWGRGDLELCITFRNVTKIKTRMIVVVVEITFLRFFTSSANVHIALVDWYER